MPQGMAGVRRVRALSDRLCHVECHGVGYVRRERRQIDTPLQVRAANEDELPPSFVR
jgi:hypothetical protein